MPILGKIESSLMYTNALDFTQLDKNNNGKDWHTDF